ncbi:MAG: glycoside hydrolase family 75 protein [Verrucomicrobiales bacterium]
MNDPLPSETDSPGTWRGRPQGQQGLVGRLLLLILLGGLFILPFTGAGRRLKEGAIEVIQAAKGTVPTEERTIERTEPDGEPEAPDPQVIIQEKVVYRDPPPPALPTSFIPRKSVAVGELFNGIKIQTKLESAEGGLASVERKNAGAYQVTFQVNLTVPKANATLPELAALNDHLPKALPGLMAMVPAAKVSGFYHHLYEIKQKTVEKNLTQLDKALTRHNFFDCETVLELRHPTSGRRVLLLQGEMDVVADGSDGDRLAEFDDYVFASAHFQGTTSYSWKKRTTKVNPLIGKYEGRIEEARKKLAATSSSAQKKSLEGDIAYYKRMIASLKTTSYLIASEDPFIVLPLSMRGYAGIEAFAPQLGDYAVVVSGNRLLPAIVGDYGPREKVGEASLRIAKEINSRATPYARPESDLKISYFIFPGSADKPFGPPSYAKWHERCTALLTEIGGLGDGYALHQWEDRLTPKPDPAAPPATAQADGETGVASEIAEAADGPAPSEAEPESSTPAPEVR